MMLASAKISGRKRKGEIQMSEKICMFPGVTVRFEEEGAAVVFTRFQFRMGMSIHEKCDALHKALDCDLVEIVPVTIAGREYFIFCDESGKLNPWVPTYPRYDEDGKCCDVISNSFVVVKEDAQENFLQMSVQEFAEVEKHLRIMVPRAAEEVRKRCGKAKHCDYANSNVKIN